MLPLLLLLIAIQFINIVDFMLVLPLGVDFSTEIQMQTDDLGWLSAVYKSSAAVSALASAMLLDAMPRHRSLLLAFCGLISAILLSSIAQDFFSLLLTRILAGICTAPITALTVTILIEQTPAEKRGIALSRFMQAFPLSTVIGVPLGLELSDVFHWRITLLSLALSGAIVALIYWWSVVSRTQDVITSKSSSNHLVLHPPLLLFYIASGLAMFGGFLLIPILSVYFHHNLDLPRAWLGELFLLGGLGSLLCLQFAGYWVDRWGTVIIGALGTVLLVIVLIVGFADEPSLQWLLPVMLGFNIALSLRGLAHQLFLAYFTRSEQCAGLLALNAAVQHVAAALGSFVSAQLLDSQADGRLIGVPLLAWLSIACALTMPLFLCLIHKRFLHTTREHLCR